jgi:hypothetical protein
MTKYFFHEYLNGQRTEDFCGLEFVNQKQACEHAVHQVSVHLKEAVRPTCDTFLTIEVSDGERMVTVIRGKVIIEKH